MAEHLGYDDVLDSIPAAAIEAFVGVGNPVVHADLSPGERVLDVGCGGGLDALVAASLVGFDGSVVGIDVTAEMVARARLAAEQSPWVEASFVHANAEEMPFEDGRFDVVLSNGCLNLSPRKRELLGEVFRVLRPGGRVALCDAVLKPAKAEEVTSNPDDWSL
jgi:ubiquinone/menaquinone biosynthesis C-methylase UbiE